MEAKVRMVNMDIF